MPRQNNSPSTDHDSVQPDPTLNEGRARPVGITAAVLAAAVIVIVALYGASQPARQDSTGPVAAAPPAASAETTGQGPVGNNGSGTTGQGTTNSVNPARPQQLQQQEQDPIEQNTRP